MPSFPRAALLSSLLMLSTSLSEARAQPPVPPATPTAPNPVSVTQERTLRVEGLGEVKVSPDEAFVDLAVETQAATAQAASEANARKMEKVIAALMQAGLARKDLQTSNYQVYPEYPQPPMNPGPSSGTDEVPRPKGYRVSNTVEAHVRDLAKVGVLLDVALKAGANRVDAVRFGLSKPETSRDAALRDAVERARQSAQVLATALGVKLGAVLDVSTVAEPQRPIPLARFAMASAESADTTTPIQPQEQTVQATVRLVYAISPATPARP